MQHCPHKYDKKNFSSKIHLLILSIEIKRDNVLHSINDETLLTDFVAAEMKDPSPRRIVDGIPAHASRRFGYPKAHGIAVLSDFGSTIRGEEKRNHNAGPDIYRAHEVMIKADWSYPVDIWNVGVMSGTSLKVNTCFKAKMKMGQAIRPAHI